MLLAVPDEEGDKGQGRVIQPERPENPVGNGLSDAALRLGARSRSIQHLLVGFEAEAASYSERVDGKVITTVEQTQGADEVWYNSGDNSSTPHSASAQSYPQRH